MGNFGRSKVVFEISGANISRLVANCAAKNIKLENIMYKSATIPTIELKVDARDAKQIIKLAHKCKLKVHIKRRMGIYFFLNRNRTRWALLLGAVLGCVALILLSRFVWVIELKGNNRISDEKMLSLLSQVGIKRFAPVDKAKFNLAVRDLKLKEPKIANLSIITRGVRVTVNVSEKLEQIKQNEQGEYRSLYSKAEGVITQILSYTGRAVVKKGDIVKKGDLLINGDLSTEEKSIRVFASGKVLANIAYSFSSTVGPKVDAQVRSGKSYKTTVVSIFERELFECNYNDYEMEYDKVVRTNTSLVPIKFKTAWVYELIKGKKALSEKELYAMAERQAYNGMARGIDKTGKIVSKKTIRQKNKDGSVTVIINVVTEENIIAG